MGSLPPGVPADAYAAIAARAAAPRTRVVIDSVVGLAPLLAALADRGCVDVVVKVNARELSSLLGEPLEAGSDSAGAADAAGLAALVERKMHTIGKAAFVCWTDGPFGAGAYDAAACTRWAFSMPPLPRPVVSPIGAGDAVAGATLSAWLKDDADGGQPAPLRAFRFGLACGAASCLTPDNAAFDVATATALYEGISLEAFPLWPASS